MHTFLALEGVSLSLKAKYVIPKGTSNIFFFLFKEINLRGTTEKAEKGREKAMMEKENYIALTKENKIPPVPNAPRKVRPRHIIF